MTTSSAYTTRGRGAPAPEEARGGVHVDGLPRDGLELRRPRPPAPPPAPPPPPPPAAARSLARGAERGLEAVVVAAAAAAGGRAGRTRGLGPPRRVEGGERPVGGRHDTPRHAGQLAAPVPLVLVPLPRAEERGGASVVPHLLVHRGPPRSTFIATLRNSPDEGTSGRPRRALAAALAGHRVRRGGRHELRLRQRTQLVVVVVAFAAATPRRLCRCHRWLRRRRLRRRPAAAASASAAERVGSMLSGGRARISASCRRTSPARVSARQLTRCSFAQRRRSAASSAARCCRCCRCCRCWEWTP